MINYNEIRQVHLEISSLCNANCPYCPRNFWGYPYNDGYPEANFTLENAQHIFTSKFLRQLQAIRINGNFGDIVMNSESPDIVEYFFSINESLDLSISTNGSAQSKDFWKRLGKTKAKVLFCLDGLNDTHHLYRQNTSWNQILKNAEIFISEGGNAIWKMIKFDHNQHQIDACRELSENLKFKKFLLVHSTRNVAPVFDKNGKLVHRLGNYSGETNFKKLFFKRKTDMVLVEDITPGRVPKKSLTCETKLNKEIYISSTGEIYPCCFTGFYPKTFGHGYYHQAINAQLIPLLQKNNALQYNIEECIEWFNNIEKSWSIATYEDGRLICCDDNCGK
jgi:sulfatase maturation enzyme AslB (radical SAM superfamily)